MMKIQLIGDSVAGHYRPHLEAVLRGVMEFPGTADNDEPPDKPVQPRGCDSSAVLASLQTGAEVDAINADLLLINCGLHDIKTDPATGRKQVPLEAYRKNLEAIVAVVAKIPTRLVWIRTTPCDENIHNVRVEAFHRFAADCEAYNRAADEIMELACVPSIDLHTFTLNLGPDIYADHVHFPEHIREKQGAFIAGWLMGFLQQDAE